MIVIVQHPFYQILLVKQTSLSACHAALNLTSLSFHDLCLRNNSPRPHLHGLNADPRLPPVSSLGIVSAVKERKLAYLRFGLHSVACQSLLNFGIIRISASAIARVAKCRRSSARQWCKNIKGVSRCVGVRTGSCCQSSGGPTEE